MTLSYFQDSLPSFPISIIWPPAAFLAPPIMRTILHNVRRRCAERRLHIAYLWWCLLALGVSSRQPHTATTPHGLRPPRHGVPATRVRYLDIWGIRLLWLPSTIYIFISNIWLPISLFLALNHRHAFPPFTEKTELFANKRPDMREHFVIDPLISKRQQLLLATQLCRMVLKVRRPLLLFSLHTTPLGAIRPPPFYIGIVRRARS